MSLFDYVKLPQGGVAVTQRDKMATADDGPTVDMAHKPMGGEVPGMRATVDRFVKQLVDNGNDPTYARRVAESQARRMERRLERGPKGSR